MEYSRFSTIGSVVTAALLASMLVLGGCSDSLTGTAPPDRDQDETVQQRAQHNQPSHSEDTDPGAGHNTSSED